ncbi:thermonuclease family protein [Brevundimonas sp. NPDC092305]|uniref:thermonuclease family protein n=1 Tax=Brevundimonas sp. NPDC092305 TaxID=3363957 RepID=UPI00382605C2
MIALPPDPPAIIGRASVIDGDTIEIHGKRIRLWGIDAPEAGQTCSRGGETYRCGQEAATALAEDVRDRVVICMPEGRPDRYGRIVAKCVTFDDAGRRIAYDLAGGMVTAGLAVDYPRYSRRAYAQHQATARAGRAGMWAGEFQMPWEWRAR